jgi:hypothetical protein
MQYKRQLLSHSKHPRWRLTDSRSLREFANLVKNDAGNRQLNHSFSTVTVSPAATVVVKGTTLKPFLLVIRQNKWYLEVATSRTVVSSLIVTTDNALSGPVRVTVITLAP